MEGVIFGFRRGTECSVVCETDRKEVGLEEDDRGRDRRSNRECVGSLCGWRHEGGPYEKGSIEVPRREWAPKTSLSWGVSVEKISL